jgi:diguanylate cyclase (GGDEF)-like protein
VVRVTDGGPGAATPRGRASSFFGALRAPTHLELYLAAVFLAGGLALLVDASSVRMVSITGHEAAVTLILAASVVIGELLPLTVRRGDSVESYTVSGTAAIALIITGPLWVAALAQISAGLVDDIRCRRSSLKMAFNVSQYALGIAASRVVYALLSGQQITGFTPHFPPGALFPALMAGFTYFLVNTALVSVVSALADGRPPWSFLLVYFRADVATAMTLLAVGPIVLTALNFSLLTWPLCALPVLAVSGALAASKREMMAMHDSLTGLPNRALLLERAGKALRDRGEQLVALLFIDLDHFKQVNDAMGHPVGDELLRQIGQRLAGVIRPGDFAARLGGDEFAVLCHELADVETALDLANRIASSLAGPVILQGVSLHVEASVGVALSPVHAKEVDVLLQRADVALYRAKAIGPGSVIVYDSSYDTNSVERLTLMEQLRSGLENELVLHYQPKCRLSDGATVGVEALVRWQHPTLGLLPPARFLVAAENTGLMMPLTIQVLRQALAQWGEWREHGLELSVSVNVSARNIAQADLPAQVAVLLAQFEMPGRSLLLEVTESSVISNPEAATAVIQELLAMGVGISIDDFGTGHSSLAYIKDLSPSEVKIDQSFVSVSANSPRDTALVRAAVELGRSLGMQVVAEGVETPAVLRILAESGCDLVQGFLILPPVPADQLAAWSRQPQTWSRNLRPLASCAEPEDAVL